MGQRGGASTKNVEVCFFFPEFLSKASSNELGDRVNYSGFRGSQPYTKC